MNTATSLISSATLTAAAEVGAGATKVDLNAITTDNVILEVIATNGSSGPGVGRIIFVNLAFSSTSITSDIPATLVSSSQRFSVSLRPEASAVRVFMSDPIVKKARYAYVWYSHETMDNAVTLSANIIS